MHLRKRLLADVAGALLAELGAVIDALRFRPLEPQRRIHCGAALDAQACLFDDLAVMRLGGLALGAPKCFRHSRHIVPFGLCDQTGEHE